MLAEPVAVAAHVDEVAVVDQAVDQGGRHDLVVEDLAPVLEALVPGEHGAGMLVLARKEQRMDEPRKARIRDIKARVSSMLEERGTVPETDSPVASPGKFWSEECSNFDYMQMLPEECFAKLRLHTYHLTRDDHWGYKHSEEEFVRMSGLLGLTHGIPSNLVLDEPSGGMGFRLHDGRFVSLDTIRFQRTVNTLYRQGILDALKKQTRPSALMGARPSLLEIGAGYGGLAHHLSKILGDSSYVIVDLPEVLLFSASYLSLLNETKKIYVYSPADFSSFMDSSEARSYDFILLPNYRVDALRRWRFNLVLNTNSFMEMREEQVVAYLDFVCDTCDGVLYSLNMDKHPYSNELSSLTELLKARFALHTVESSAVGHSRVRVKLKLWRALRSVARSLGILDWVKRSGLVRPLTYHPSGYNEYICTPVRPATPA